MPRFALILLPALVACSDKDSDDTGSEGGDDTGSADDCDVTVTVFDYADQAGWTADAPDCGGTTQSPIDFTEGELDTGFVVPDVELDYGSTALMAVNNGHSVEYEVEEGSEMLVDGEAWPLVQFHFHAPSEHTIEGDNADMEMHLVHKSGSDYAVLGVFIMGDAEVDDTWFAESLLWSEIPLGAGECLDAEGEVDLAALASRLPAESELILNYQGSLTTPPCSETVDWFVLAEPIAISTDQLLGFLGAYDGNNRDTQAMNGRTFGLGESWGG